MKLEKYSREWKYQQQEKRGGWSQKHTAEGPNGSDVWKWHTIRHDTEYAQPGHYWTKADCEADNKAVSS